MRALVAAGVHSVMSFQLFTHGANTCALNLFGFAARAFDPSLQVLQVLTGPDDEIGGRQSANVITLTGDADVGQQDSLLPLAINVGMNDVGRFDIPMQQTPSCA